jgi:hypothetical protein
MQKLFYFLLSGSLFCASLAAVPPSTSDSAVKSSLPQKENTPSPPQEEGLVVFTPPPNWKLADTNLLPKLVRVLVVGKGPSPFPPSMNLSLEPYKGTLKQYLKIIKNRTLAQGYEWKDLGTIRTEAGNASLSQVDTNTQWGVVRLMHVILLKNGTIYILTASALKDEFSLFYKDFFASMRSLRVVKNALDMVDNSDQRKQLKIAADQLQAQWQELLAQKQQDNPAIDPATMKEDLFKSESFQNRAWKPFREMVEQKYSHLGPEWQSFFLQKMEDQLFDAKS